MKTTSIINIIFIALIASLLSIGVNAQNLSAPKYLESHIEESDVTLSWGMDGTSGNWLAYDNGSTSISLGAAQPGIFRIATLWPESSLEDFAGKPITKLAFFANSFYTVYTLKIWTGNSAETLVYSQELSGLQIGGWNEVFLSTPVAIEPGTTYWLGLEINQLVELAGSVVLDSGPAIAGFGDMIYLGGAWASLSSFTSFDGNWLVRYFVSNDENPEAFIPIGTQEAQIAQVSPQLLQTIDNLVSHSLQPDEISELLGANVYRDGQKLNNDPVNDASYTDINVAVGTYTYGVTLVYSDGESDPIERTVQVGAPSLNINPAFIATTLEGGAILNTTIILANTGSAVLEWEATNLPAWMSFNVAGASIAPGGSFNAILSINTLGLPNGANSALVKINTNNNNYPQISLPVVITIEGQLSATFDVDVLDFGMVQVFESRMDEINITNQTDALLMFLSFTTPTANFAAYPSSWAIQPGQSLSVVVVFEPTSIDAFTDTLIVEHFGYMGGGVMKLPLTGQGIALPPSNLTSVIDESSITLDWLAPGASSDELRFGNGQPFNTIGTSSGIYEFAARFTPIDLMPYNGKQLEKVGFYPHAANAGFKLKVYTGANAEVELINLPISNIEIYQWNDIDLPFPIALSQVDYIWIGYETEQTEVAFIAGVDGGPGVNGSGDLIRVNGNEWMTLGDNGWSYNWNIRGILGDDDGESLQMVGGFKAAMLMGYNVYRDGEKLNSELLSETTFTDEIQQGEIYTYGVTAVYDYGESYPAEIMVSTPQTFVMPQGWDFAATTRAHNIHIPLESFLPGVELQQGDMIGVFYNDNGVEKCAGAIAWNHANAMLTAYGNDPESPLKTGFDQDEPLVWKVFFNQSQTTYPLEVTYSHEMPHYDGTFKMMGLSMLQTIEMGTVSVNEISATQETKIYPNPSSGKVTINGTQASDQVTVFDTNGRIVMTLKATENTTQININQSGLFFVEIKGLDKSTRSKLIIQ